MKHQVQRPLGPVGERNKALSLDRVLHPGYFLNMLGEWFFLATGGGRSSCIHFVLMNHIAFSVFFSRSMPISADRAERACRAVVAEPNELGQLLGTLHRLDDVLERCRLREEDSDGVIVCFLKSFKCAGEHQFRHRVGRGLLHACCHAWRIVYPYRYSYHRRSPSMHIMSPCSEAISNGLMHWPICRHRRRRR